MKCGQRRDLTDPLSCQELFDTLQSQVNQGASSHRVCDPGKTGHEKDSIFPRGLGYGKEACA